MFTRTIGKLISGLIIANRIDSDWHSRRIVETNFEYIDYLPVKVWRHSITAQSLDGHHITFSGFDRKFNIAVKKSISEFYEAVASWETNQDWKDTRSGVAAHSDPSIAWKNAYRELVERDAFICHLLDPGLSTKTLPSVLVRRSNIMVGLTQLQSADRSVVCVIARTRIDPTAPWIIGLGNGPSIEIAAQGAVQECIMLVNDWAFREAIDAGLKSERSDVLRSHYEASLDPRVDNAVENIFSGGGAKQMRVFAGTSACEVVFQKIYSKKVHVIRLSHPRLSPLAFGDRWEQSRPRIARIFEDRGLSLSAWIRHPLL